MIETKFSFCDNQFGFTKDDDCSKVLFAVKNVAKYFRDKYSNIYKCSLNLAKALITFIYVLLIWLKPW